jgi:AcrR family transcriptional regulator
MLESPKILPSPPKVALLKAAKSVLLSDGYAGLSTRAIAAAANTQMSQIRYHFGSKEGMVLALFEYMNAQLIERQSGLMSDPNISLATKWDVACDYLDVDIDSGYVRVLQEMLAVGYSNAKVRAAVHDSLRQWTDVLTTLVAQIETPTGNLGPFDAEDLSAIICSAFIGSEALILIGSEEQGTPIRRALRKFGHVIRVFESQTILGE